MAEISEGFGGGGGGRGGASLFFRKEGVQLVNHEYYYRQNWVTCSPVTNKN